LNLLPQGQPSYSLAGSPITIATQMPDVAPGSTPVAFGDFSKAYAIVERKAPTVLGRFLSHLQVRGTSRGGATTCPNAARLLRIR
jgi:predicted phage gp36 major capsid-like protein